MQKVQVVVYYERSTKGSHLYKNINAKMYGMYVPKALIADPVKALKVTFQEATEEEATTGGVDAKEYLETE